MINMNVKLKLALKIIAFILAGILLFVGGLLTCYYLLEHFQTKNGPDKWESDIAKIEAQYNGNYPQNEIIFYGSSSIYQWSTMKEDLSPLPVHNHGFGGSTLDDAMVYAERLIFPFNPKAVVIYSGTNDMGNEWVGFGKDAKKAYYASIGLMCYIHEHLPTAKIYYIASTPNEFRWDLWERMSECNQLVKDYCSENSAFTFIDTVPSLLNENGKYRSELFLDDGLHFNEEGYKVWTSIISGDTTKEYYREDIYVGYRYFDTFGVKPRYHFGYGLSYTKFNIKMLTARVDGTTVKMSVAVKNVGKHNGKETIQIYVSAPKGTLNKEYQRLVAFGKTKLLSPEEEQVLDICFDIKTCASYFETTSSFVLEKGDYIVRMGNSSATTTVAVIVTLSDDTIVSKHKSVCPVKEQYERIIPKLPAFDDNITNTTRLVLQSENIVTDENQYHIPEKYSDERVDAILKKLSVNDMIKLCVGSGSLYIFSKKKLVVPGSVGRTTNKLYKKGLLGVHLADGPAGLRLMRTSAVSKFLLKMVDYFMAFVEYIPDTYKKFIMADKNSPNVLYQFCTAFPVGTALAQTWNTSLCAEIGKAISKEMVKYNVTFWLAPAMNIHRNPLCGRNFEYYSEDPLLTGIIASAITKGIQSVDGNYATIKHFVCNNQEDNRNKSNSIVSERALREIYLRGFEICVKDAHPKAIMTSYNLINGVYACNNYDLIGSVLRNEWGFDGVVMTDWNATEPNLARNDLAIAVGNDMIMPGNKYCRKQIKKGLKDKTLTKEQLKKASANIIRAILNSSVANKFPVKKV